MLILGAELSLNHLSEFPGPPHRAFSYEIELLERILAWGANLAFIDAPPRFDGSVLNVLQINLSKITKDHTKYHDENAKINYN